MIKTDEEMEKDFNRKSAEIAMSYSLSHSIASANKLKSQLAAAKKALDWYADLKTYRNDKRLTQRIEMDCGQVARDALAEIKELGKEKL